MSPVRASGIALIGGPSLDPITLIVAAVATGAAAGTGDVVKQAITDAYAALKRRISNDYGVVDAEVLSVESEPEEDLRRQLLAKQLTKVGAGEDEQLVAAAQELLNLVIDEAPQAAQIVGIELNRVDVGGDIEVIDVAVQGGSGVTATDVSTGGSFTISNVRASAGEPPHPPQARR